MWSCEVLYTSKTSERRQKAEEETPTPLPLSCLPSLNSASPCDSSALSSTGDSCFLSSSSETMIILINKQWGRSIYYANSWKGSQKTPGLFPVPLICRLNFPWVSQFPGFGEQLRGVSISAMITAHCHWFSLSHQTVKSLQGRNHVIFICFPYISNSPDYRKCFMSVCWINFQLPLSGSKIPPHIAPLALTLPFFQAIGYHVPFNHYLVIPPNSVHIPQPNYSRLTNPQILQFTNKQIKTASFCTTLIFIVVVLLSFCRLTPLVPTVLLLGGGGEKSGNWGNKRNVTCRAQVKYSWHKIGVWPLPH